jgi:glycosyltransferase involved in cell wall biosynthesis
MKTPILIAAHNEESYIERTLSSLPRDCTPVLIANGCSDKTAEIGEGFGIKPIVLEEASKTAALQTGLKSLGEHALSGFIILDADTRPLFCNRWLSAYREKFEHSQNGVYCGSLIFRLDNGVFPGVVRSSRNYLRDVHAYFNRNERVYGANMGVKMNQSSLEYILSLPQNLWPGEDRAIRDSVVNEGGVYHMDISPSLVALSSARSHPSLLRRFIKGKEFAVKHTERWYADKAPKSNISYDDWLKKL